VHEVLYFDAISVVRMYDGKLCIITLPEFWASLVFFLFELLLFVILWKLYDNCVNKIKRIFLWLCWASFTDVDVGGGVGPKVLPEKYKKLKQQNMKCKHKCNSANWRVLRQRKVIRCLL